MTPEQKALIVAMELLRIQVQDNTIALAANTLRVGALTPAGAPGGGQQAVQSAAPAGGTQRAPPQHRQHRRGHDCEKRQNHEQSRAEAESGHEITQP